jgi:hypothetical protein
MIKIQNMVLENDAFHIIYTNNLNQIIPYTHKLISKLIIIMVHLIIQLNFLLLA